MKRNLIGKELWFLLKNPMTYLGIVLMVSIVWVTIKPYFSLYNGVRPAGTPIQYDAEGDIDTGYIPTPSLERLKAALGDIEKGLVNDFGLTQGQAAAEIKKIEASKWGVDEISAYLEEKYSMKGARNSFDLKSFKHADYNEMKGYLEEVFKDRRYTQSLAYKYSDFLSIGSILFAIIVFVLLLTCDMKKDMYSLLHVKLITGWAYFSRKLLAGVIFICAVIVVFTFVIDMVAVKAGGSYGFEVGFGDIWKSILIFNFPNIVLTGALVIFTTLLFKNVLPTIPILLLYFVYSNMGSVTDISGYVYKIKPFALLIRLPGEFAALTIPEGTIQNQMFIIGLTVILIMAGGHIWERRRSV